MKTDVEFTVNIQNLPLALTVPEVSKVLRVSSSLVYELVRCGQLSSLKIGRKIRIPRSALLAYLGESAS